MYACVCPFVRLHVCVSVSFYVYVHICAFSCARVHVCDRACACLPVYLYVRMCVSVPVLGGGRPGHGPGPRTLLISWGPRIRIYFLLDVFVLFNLANLSIFSFRLRRV